MEMVYELIVVLQRFKEASEELEGDSYPTLALVYPTIYALVDFVTRGDSTVQLNTLTAEVREVLTILQSQLIARFPAACDAAIMATWLHSSEIYTSFPANQMKK